MAAAGEETIFRADGSSFPAEYFSPPSSIRAGFPDPCSASATSASATRSTGLKTSSSPPSATSCAPRSPPSAERWDCFPPAFWARSSDKAANLLRIALTNSDRLVRLINDILDLERIQSGREPLAFRTVQLAEIVRQAIDGMQPVAEAAGVQLIHDTTQVEIAADPDRLLQVLTNLLSNAIKFSPPNSTVSVMLRPGASGVTALRDRSGARHSRRQAGADLRPLPAGGRLGLPPEGRKRPGPGHLPHHRPAALRDASGPNAIPSRGSTFRVFLPYQTGPVGPSRSARRHIRSGAGPRHRPAGRCQHGPSAR